MMFIIMNKKKKKKVKKEESKSCLAFASGQSRRQYAILFAIDRRWQAAVMYRFSLFGARKRERNMMAQREIIGRLVGSLLLY